MIPRSITAADCDTCLRDPRFLTPREREAYYAHREEHFRVDRRRAQYRAAKARQAARKTPERLAGYLHEVGCSGGHRRRRGGCTPIPVYREDVA
jgi:hypothetical protein